MEVEAVSSEWSNVEGSISYHGFLKEFRSAFAGELDENTLAEAEAELEKTLAHDTQHDDVDRISYTGIDVYGAADTRSGLVGKLGPRVMLAGTSLSVSISNSALTGVTNGKKKFKGRNAAHGSSKGFGYLDKSSTKLYTDTKSYQLSPGKVDTIVFKNASGKILGTWRGKLIPGIAACSGPGSWGA